MMPCLSRTVAPVGIRSNQGDTMYRPLIETDAPLAIILAFAVVVFAAGIIARALRWLATAEHRNKSNARPPSAETI
jgi:hypothetical protein